MKEMHNRPIAEKRENGEDGEQGSHNIGMETSRMPFLMLGLDLPPPPLFTDVMEKNIIPQVLFKFIFLILMLIGKVLPFSCRQFVNVWSSYFNFPVLNVSLY